MADSTWEGDTARVRQVLVRLLDVDPRAIRAWIHYGDPKAWMRAGQFKGRRTYKPSSLAKAERDMAWCMCGAVADRPWLSNIALVAIFFMHDAIRRDADNLLKTVLDAGNEARIWKDDCQVTTVIGFVELDAESPRTVVAMCPTTSTLDRTIKAKKQPRRLLESV